MISIILDNRLRIPLEGLPANVVSELRLEFQHRNPDHWKAKSRGFYARNIPQHISTWKSEEGRLSLPRGGWKRVKSILVAKGIQYRVIDRRSLGEAIRGVPEHLLTLYDYQERCVAAAVAKENCLLKCPTGAGKTCICLAFAARINVPTLIIVNSAGLMAQWIERIKREMDFDAGVIQGKRFDLRPITVAMQQSAWRMTDEKWSRVNDYFGAVISDECDLAAAKTFISVVDRFTCKYRLGVSADHTRKDGKHFLLYDVFGTLAAEISREELIEKRFVLDVEIQMIETEFEAQWYRNAQTAFRMRESGESLSDIHAELLKYSPELKIEDVPKGNPDYTKLIEEIVTDKNRNELIADRAFNLVATGKRVVILSSRVDHCVRLRTMMQERGVDCGLLVGEEKEEFADTLASLKSGDIKLGIGTVQAFGRGLDAPEITDGIIVVPLHTNKQLFGQVRGRMCRTAVGKSLASLWYYYDKHVFGKTPVKNLSAWNKVCMVGDKTAKEYLK